MRAHSSPSKRTRVAEEGILTYYTATGPGIFRLFAYCSAVPAREWIRKTRGGPDLIVSGRLPAG